MIDLIFTPVAKANLDSLPTESLRDQVWAIVENLMRRGDESSAIQRFRLLEIAGRAVREATVRDADYEARILFEDVDGRIIIRNVLVRPAAGSRG